MKVFGVVASPRKGNTYDLCTRFVKALSRYVSVDVELRLLNEFRIEGCRGCTKCIYEGRCSIDDDLNAVIERMKQADLVILASPVYVCSVSYLMKLLMDRTGWANHYPPLVGKKCVVVATTAASCLSPVLKALRSYAVSLGMTCLAEVGSAYVDGKPVNERKLGELLDDVAKYVARVLKGLARPRVKVEDVVLFNSMKYRAMYAKQWNPKEFEYWRRNGLLERRYYDPNAVVPTVVRLRAFAKSLLAAREYMQQIVVRK